MCVCVCVLHDNSKNNRSIHLKLEHIVVYEKSSDEFDIGQCPIKDKVWGDFEIFLHISALEHCRKTKFRIYVHQTLMYTKCEQCYA